MPGMGQTMLGRGVYDAAEIGRLLGHDAEWVIRWSTASGAGPPVVEPSFDRAFSFADLVSFRVGLLVRQRGVSDRHLRHGVETLRSRTGNAKPLASRAVIDSLATSGSSFLAELGPAGFEDIGRGGQGVFQEVIRVHLTRIEFDTHGDPERWVPTEGVLIDPAVQAGAPCISGTRVPTATIAALLADSDPDEVALDFNISVEAVNRARDFESQLAHGVGLAA